MNCISISNQQTCLACKHLVLVKCKYRGIHIFTVVRWIFLALFLCTDSGGYLLPVTMSLFFALLYGPILCPKLHKIESCTFFHTFWICYGESVLSLLFHKCSIPSRLHCWLLCVVLQYCFETYTHRSNPAILFAYCFDAERTSLRQESCLLPWCTYSNSHILLLMWRMIEVLIFSQS